MAIGILPHVTGVSVHDGWIGNWAARTCRHALCNIHHLSVGPSSPATRNCWLPGWRRIGRQPARRPGQRGRVKQSPARNLLERLYLHQEPMLAFLDDPGIPFDNNQAERDLRGLKLHQKASGCFRSHPGAEAFKCLRASLSCLRKTGWRALSAPNRTARGHIRADMCW